MYLFFHDICPQLCRLFAFFLGNQIDFNMDLIKQRLLDAQNKAGFLFSEMEARNIIAPGKTEKQINIEVYNLAYELFGIKKYWHKRIVRAGENTLLPYKENPANLFIRENDIVFLDFGPVFEEWEADFGRTFVLGNNKYMLKLQSDIMVAFQEAKAFFNSKSSVTGGGMNHFVRSLAKKYNWEFTNDHCGHLIGQFPHEKVEDHEIQSYLHLDNDIDLKALDSNGKQRHWILEIHFVDKKRKIGGFTEELLTI
jgi:Xaa-Pro dipeptidase